MNERIKELIFETDEWLESNAQSDKWEREMKFAELIVSKCIALIDVNYRGDMYTGDVYACEYNNCINEQVETLEDYFGVNK